ncbi:hypothetical protein [Victivallis vadensis]|uniref:hypothetical protein n=1 Tax=Victivallis vadensis TaxID=172901 RepID=UPI00307CE1DB
MANYYEDSLRGFYYSQDSVKLTRAVLPAGTVELTECENVPFTRFPKSVKFTFLELAISFAYGSEGVTLNLFDHAGTPMRAEEHYGGREAKPWPRQRSESGTTKRSSPRSRSMTGRGICSICRPTGWFPNGM